MKISFLLRFLFNEFKLQKFYTFQIIISILVGVGAVTGISSYKTNLNQSILKESKNLMGGDITIESSEPFHQVHTDLFNSTLPSNSEYAGTVVFTSIVYNPSLETNSLSTVKALDKKFPLFGEIVTSPSNAYRELNSGEILLDENMAKNMKITIGNKISLGTKDFILKGHIIKEPGSASNIMSMAPSAIILLKDLNQTGLEQRGSRIKYNLIVKFPIGIDSKKFKEDNFQRYIKQSLTIYHNTEVGSGSQRFINSTFNFMSLLGLCAFFAGAVSILIVSRTKINNQQTEISVLKCMGADSKFLLKLYMLEIFSLSLLGTILGIALGYGFQFMIPNLLGNELSLDIQPRLTIKSILWGLFIGIVVPMLSIIESILKIINQRPIHAIRSQTETKKLFKFIKEPIFLIELVLLYAFFLLLSYLETRNLLHSLIFSAVLSFLPLILFIFFVLFRYFAKLFVKLNIGLKTINLVFKRFASNGNQMALPIVGVGSALTLLIMALMIRVSLLTISGANQKEKRPNLFVLDLRKEQLTEFNHLLKNYSANQITISPVIGAKLSKINDEFVQKENTEKDAVKRDWKTSARVRDYFLSYRENLFTTEKVVQGVFWENKDEIEISIESDFAKILGVKLNHTLSFSIHGIEIKGRITNIRTVTWSDLKPNFVVLFSPNSLKNAPAYYIGSFLIESNDIRQELIKEYIKKFPNATIVDIEKSMVSFMEMIKKVSDVVNLMTFFIVSSGFVLLVSSLYASKKARIEETILYRVLGADSNFIKKLYMIESLILSVLTFTIGSLLGFIVNYLVSHYILDIFIHIPWTELGIVFVFTCFIHSIIFLLNVNRSLKQPPGIRNKEL